MMSWEPEANQPWLKLCDIFAHPGSPGGGLLWLCTIEVQGNWALLSPS